MMKLILIILFSLNCLPSAFAAGGVHPGADTCADLTKPRGTQQFSAAGVMEFCDGYSWQPMDFSVDINSNCTDAGRQRFNAGTMEFCDSANWHSMDGGATTTTCVGAGTQIRTRTFSPIYCDGSVWHAMSPASVSSLTCNDFTTQKHCLNVSGCSWNSNYCYEPNDCPSRYDATSCNANPNCTWAAGTCGSSI